MKTQVRRWVLVAVALSAVAAFGCSKDKGGGGGSAAASSALGLLPKDVDMVMGVDFGSLRSSDLYKKYAPMLTSAMGDKLDKFKAACGFDPIESIATMVAGIKGDTGNQDVTAVVTGFKKDQVVDCMKKAAEKDGKAAELKIDGDYLEFPSPQGPMGVLFVGDQILIHKTPSGSATKDQLVAQSKQAVADSPAGSQAFNDVLAKVNTKSGLWFVVNGNAPSMKRSPVQMKVAFGSVSVTDGLALDATARMNEAKDAQQVADAAKTQVEQIKAMGFVNDISISADGADLHVKASMTQQQLEQIAGMMKGMAGAFGGGGGGLGGP